MNKPTFPKMLMKYLKMQKKFYKQGAGVNVIGGKCDKCLTLKSGIRTGR